MIRMVTLCKSCGCCEATMQHNDEPICWVCFGWHFDTMMAYHKRTVGRVS